MNAQIDSAIIDPKHSFEAQLNELVPFQEELLKVSRLFDSAGVSNSIVFFGSARILSPECAQENLKTAQNLENIDETQRAESLKRALQDIHMAGYYQAAVELAYKCTQWSQQQPPHEQFLVCSGGGPGIMEAANRGAHQAGGQSIGLSIKIPSEQSVNAYVSPALTVPFNTFFFRKFWFFYYARALIIFPGGFGTLEELFELLTSIKTGKTEHRLPIILYGSDYWRSVINFEVMVEHGTINAGDLELFTYSDSVQDAFDLIRNALEANKKVPSPSNI